MAAGNVPDRGRWRIGVSSRHCVRQRVVTVYVLMSASDEGIQLLQALFQAPGAKGYEQL
jgi:hypothetical protein